MSVGSEERIAKRYARALFDVTTPTDFDTVQEQLSAFVAAWRKSADFRLAALNPKLSDDDRQRTVDAVAEVLGGWRTESTRKTLRLMAQLRKLAVLPEFAELFSEYVREYRRNLALDVTFSTLPDPMAIETLRAHLSSSLGSQVTITTHQDPALLGGMTIRLGDRLLDRSVAGTLNRLADQLRR